MLVLPRSFEVAYEALLDTAKAVETRANQACSRWAADHGVVIRTRVKAPASCYLKLQKGGYRRLTDLEDLVGVRFVGQSTAFFESADQFLDERFAVILRRANVTPAPDNLRYDPQHVVATLEHGEFLDIEPEGPWRDLKVEFQLCTEMADAVDRASHPLAYKASKLSWRNVRTVAELRGLVGIAERILAHPEEVVSLQEERQYPLFEELNEIIKVSSDLFGEDALPDDRRRYALAVKRMLKSADADADRLRQMALESPELASFADLGVTDRVLGLVLTGMSSDQVGSFVAAMCRYDHAEAIVVPAELAELCPEARWIPAERRVVIEVM